LFFAAVMFSALSGGLGPGLLATALATIASAYFFMPPAYSPIVDGDDILEMCLQEELLPVEGDPLALERVFANLLHNALKFTPRGGKVTIGSAQHNGEARAMITDTGPGIVAEEVSTLFDKYRRTESVYSQEGTGLGLFIVKTLVEAHGGRIEVESRMGQGACFSGCLPISGASEANPQRRW
jgi:signal transduction histidine kinase